MILVSFSIRVAVEALFSVTIGYMFLISELILCLIPFALVFGSLRKTIRSKFNFMPLLLFDGPFV